MKNKRFLSDDEHETGSICWYIEKNEDADFLTVNSSVKIYDCNRSVSLDFDCLDLEDIEGRVAKVDVLIEELTKLRGALLEAK